MKPTFSKGKSKTKTSTQQMMDSSQSNSWISHCSRLLSNNRFLQLLCGLLAIQIIMAAVLRAQSMQEADFPDSDPVLSVAVDELQEIEISDGTESISLSKAGNDWKIDGDSMFPAQPGRINTLLSRLSDLKPGLPIASTINAREQLDVADDDFQRRLKIVDGINETTNLLIGTSSGLRKSHIRREGSDYIYSATLPMSDIPISVSDWLDKDLLSFSDIKSVVSGETRFRKNDSGDESQWLIDTADDDSVEIDQKKLDIAINTLTSLRVSDLWGGEAEPALEESSDGNTDSSTDINADGARNDQRLTKGELIVATETGESRLLLSKFGEDIVIERSDVPGKFTISSSQYDALYPLIDPGSLDISAVETAQ